MAMVCPVCSNAYEQRLQCPRCKVNLLPPGAYAAGSDDDPLPPHWSRNPWGRTLLGVLVAQGVYYVLRSLVFAGVLAVSPEQETAQISLFGLLSTQAFQILALFAGGLLAGAGQRGGGLYGMLVGVWNGILFTMVQGLQGEQVTAVMLYGQPILHAAVGGFGGVLGGWIWQPLAAPTPTSAKQVPTKREPGALFQLTHARVHWFRVLIGLGIAAGGYIWADTIFHLVVSTADRHLTVKATIQQTLLTLEISALAVFIGGAFAGATTWNGTAQGAWLGILGSAIFLGYQLGYRQVNDPATLGLYVGGILALGFLGGSFGGRLLPPIISLPSASYRPVPA
jgi:hypothetical protein